MINKLKSTQVKYLSKNIYSSSDLTRRRKIAQIVINTPNYFFLNVFTLF